MGLLDFAKRELELLEKNCGDDEEALKMQKLVTKDVMDIITLFANQNHSGFSAGYVLNLLDRIMRFKPISPLTGEDDEWEDLSSLGMEDMQNKRCPSVFKRPDGTAYWVEGKIFSNDGGKTWYTDSDSRVDITFPFDVPLHSENIYVDPVEDNMEVEQVEKE